MANRQSSYAQPPGCFCLVKHRNEPTAQQEEMAEAIEHTAGYNSVLSS
ncbi:MAG: hypothetical protein Q4F35_00840 [Akkermansia sp.]|nr:hypothetical protein [Akkermansia sp.]